jgi:hypothetical protein
MFKIFVKKSIIGRKCFAFPISNGMKKNLWKIVLIVFVFIFPILSLATTDTDVKIENPISSGTIAVLIRKILEGVLKIGMPIITLAVIYSGFLFVSAQGNSEKLGKAKTSLLYTLIGAAILLGSWAIAVLITDTVKAL